MERGSSAIALLSDPDPAARSHDKPPPHAILRAPRPSWRFFLFFHPLPASSLSTSVTRASLPSLFYPSYLDTSPPLVG